MQTARSIGAGLAEQGGDATRYYANDPTSAGAFMSYLTRKTTTSSNHTYYLSEADTSNTSVARMLIFENPTSLDDHARQLLKDAKKDAYFVDLSAYQKLPNFTDYAKGDEAVKAKLDAVLAAVKAKMAGDKNLSSEQAINDVVHGDFDKGVADLRRDMPAGVKLNVVEPTAMTASDALRPLATPAKVQHLIEDESTRSERRLAISQALLTRSQFLSFGKSVNDLQALKKTIDASFPGLEGDIRYQAGALTDVGTFEKPKILTESASDAMVAHMFAAGNNLDASRFITNAETQRLAQQGLLNLQTPVVALDDAVYSGNQADDLFRNNTDIPNFSVAAPSVYNRYASRIFENEADKNLITNMVTFDAADTTVSRSYSAIDERLLEEITDERAHGGMSTLVRQPQMSSDTSPGWFIDLMMHLYDIN